MKTLNRPMFRYGGPIKQGVMNGIREPKKNGGSMTQRVQPSNDGSRPGYAGPLAALAYLPAMYRGFKAARTLAPFAKNLGKMGRLKDTLLPSGKYRGMPVTGKIGPSSSLNPFGSAEKLGAAIRQNPFTTLSMPSLATSAVTGGLPVVGAAGKAFANFLVPGERFDPFGGGGDKNTEAAVLEKLTTESIKEVLTPEEEKALAASKKATAEAAKIASASFAKAEKEKRIEGYREIMDIKGMNRDATYKSLVDASKIIQEGGNLKEQLKSGKLISNLTQAASKRFDKVNQTEDAINSLILKGEIDKSISQGKDGSQLKAAKDFAAENNISVTQAYKDLGFSKTKNLSENIAIVNKSQGGSGLTTAVVAEGVRMTYPELGIPIVAKTDAELIELRKKFPLYKNASDAEIFEDLAVKNEIGNGVYIFGTSSFTMTDGKLDQLR